MSTKIIGHSLSSALLLADFGAPPKPAARQFAAGGHLSSRGTSWSPPAGLGCIWRVRAHRGRVGRLSAQTCRPSAQQGERQKVYLGVLRVLLRGCDGDVQRCSVVPFAEKGLKLDKHHIPSLPTNIAKLKYDKNSN
eukprot:1146487-Pelagomonas_calceolata.AAC.6